MTTNDSDKPCVTLSTKCLGELKRGFMMPKLLTRGVDSMVSADFFSDYLFYESMGAHRCGDGQFEPQGYRFQRVGWIYIMNH